MLPDHIRLIGSGSPSVSVGSPSIRRGMRADESTCITRDISEDSLAPFAPLGHSAGSQNNGGGDLFRVSGAVNTAANFTNRRLSACLEEGSSRVESSSRRGTNTMIRRGGGSSGEVCGMRSDRLSGISAAGGGAGRLPTKMTVSFSTAENHAVREAIVCPAPLLIHVPRPLPQPPPIYGVASPEWAPRRRLQWLHEWRYVLLNRPRIRREAQSVPLLAENGLISGAYQQQRPQERKGFGQELSINREALGPQSPPPRPLAPPPRSQTANNPISACLRTSPSANINIGSHGPSSLAATRPAEDLPNSLRASPSAFSVGHRFSTPSNPLLAPILPYGRAALRSQSSIETDNSGVGADQNQKRPASANTSAVGTGSSSRNVDARTNFYNRAKSRTQKMSLLVTASFTLCWMPYIIGYMLNSFSQISNLTDWLAGTSAAQINATGGTGTAAPNDSLAVHFQSSRFGNLTVAANHNSGINQSDIIFTSEQPLDVAAYVLGWSDVISSFATLNSLINPLIYAMFHLRRRSSRRQPPVSVVGATFHRTTAPAHHLNSAHAGNGNTGTGNIGAHKVSSNNNLNNNSNNTNQSSARYDRRAFPTYFAKNIFNWRRVYNFT